MPTEKEIKVNDRADKLWKQLFFARDKFEQKKMIEEAMQDLFKTTRTMTRKHIEASI